MSFKETKFGKKKSGNKFDREKKFVCSEQEILLADKEQELYKEDRKKERHQRRVEAGLEDDEDKNKKEEPVSEPLVEPVNKYDIKKFGSLEEAEKYLLHCHTCGRDITKGSEFCNDKCKDFILVYNNLCKWNGDCKICKLSKRVKKDETDDDR